jgi:hypothetical protein
MVSTATMKLLLYIAATLDYDMILMDLVCAFLTKTVNTHCPRRSPADPPPPDETYYVRRPPGTHRCGYAKYHATCSLYLRHPLGGCALRLDFL